MFFELKNVGVVAIGRNEGDRLKECLKSLPSGLGVIVYVDSDSTDGSVAFAKEKGAEVVCLDMSVPFTAARARNAGFKRLQKIAPDIEYIQFIDADCKVIPDWFQEAITVLDSEEAVVAVCGRRRERYPNRSYYNLICDIEWRSPPIGEVKSFGGDVMIRTKSLKNVGGYDPSVIAAEDDELSIRLRASGGKIIRLDRICTLHDANITKVSQWWRRAKRAGHGYMHLFSRYGWKPEQYFKKNVHSSVFFGFALPFTSIITAVTIHPYLLTLFILYPLLFIRIFINTSRTGFDRRESLIWSLSCVGAKFPQFFGMLSFLKRLAMKKEFTIIEYKS